MSVSPQQLCSLCTVHGTRERISLPERASHGTQARSLLRRLDTLCNRANTKIMRNLKQPP